jgi:AcrR family transcriptional regulator
MSSTPRGRRTRNLIIERTAAVFDQQGFAGASLTQLVAATGLTRGAFYFHFDSKVALAEAIVATQQERWLPIVDELQTSEPDPLRRLLRLTFRSGSLFQGDLVMRAGSRLMTERSLIRRELWRSYPWWVDSVRRLLAEAVDEISDVSQLATPSWPPSDRVPPGISPGIAALAEHLVGMSNGVLQQAIAAGQDDLPERVRTSWMATLPWLCRSPERCLELTVLVEELTDQMREAGRGAAGEAHDQVSGESRGEAGPELGDADPANAGELVG